MRNFLNCFYLYPCIFSCFHILCLCIVAFPVIMFLCISLSSIKSMISLQRVLVLVCKNSFLVFLLANIVIPHQPKKAQLWTLVLQAFSNTTLNGCTEQIIFKDSLVLDYETIKFFEHMSHAIKFLTVFSLSFPSYFLQTIFFNFYMVHMLVLLLTQSFEIYFKDQHVSDFKNTCKKLSIVEWNAYSLILLR